MINYLHKGEYLREIGLFLKMFEIALKYKWISNRNYGESDRAERNLYYYPPPHCKDMYHPILYFFQSVKHYVFENYKMLYPLKPLLQASVLPGLLA